MKRRFQYSLRSLLFLFTALGVWLGFTVAAARRQREVVAAIKVIGGEVLYDWQLVGDWTKQSGRSEPPGPAALRRLLGDEYFQSVEGVFFGEQPGFGDERMPPFEQLKTIKYLGFYATGVSDRILPRVESLPRLSFLDISCTRVTDEGLRRVGQMHNLQELWLGDRWRGFDKISDAGIPHLKPLMRLSRLTLDGCITEQSIATLKQFQNLRELKIYNCLDDAGIHELCEALPHCKVEHGFPD
jgi:hypothetical protein